MKILLGIFLLWANANDKTCGSIWDIGEARERRQQTLVKERAKEQGIELKEAKQQLDLESVVSFLFAGSPKEVETINFPVAYLSSVKLSGGYQVRDLTLQITRNLDLNHLFSEGHYGAEVPGSNFVTSLFLQAVSSGVRERRIVSQFFSKMSEGIGFGYSPFMDLKVYTPHRLEKIIEIREIKDTFNFNYMITFVKKENGQLREVRVTREIITGDVSGNEHSTIRFMNESF